MNMRNLILCVPVLLAGCVRVADKPNVLIFLIDDLGYGDIAPFGSTINKTPNLDRLASEGVKFTNFYNGSTQCSPSRTALLTGCYADRVGMQEGVCWPDDPKALSPSETTLAEMLREAGYATGCFGKWHLGHKPGYLPPAQGFDEYWGIPYSNDMWSERNKNVAPGTPGKRMLPPLPLMHNNDAVAAVLTGEDQSLLTRVFHDKAQAFIRANRQRPFFAYIPLSAVHGPRFGNKDFMEAAGGDDLRAQVEEIDDCVGWTMELLRELKIDDKTLVLFFSDNGGSQGTNMGPLRGGKAPALRYEGHQRTCFIAWWPGRIPAGAVTDQVTASIDLFPSLARLAGGKLPAQTIDGRDITELLFNPSAATSEPRVRYSQGEGLREGKWKLLQVKQKWELYDLESDRGETTDLAAQYPDRVEAMKTALEAWNARLTKEARPHAEMPDIAPLIAEGQESCWPTLTEWYAR
jgi:arylsulfatase A